MLQNTEYTQFLIEIKEKIREAQYAALKTVNTHLTQLYWDIGKSIVEKQTALGWGKSVVETLSKDLQAEFPNVRGFSARNLWNMREFYNQYQQATNLQPLVAEISWAKHLIILSKCKDNLERQFYILATKKYGWSKEVLIHQVENQSYAKYLLNQTNFDQTIPEKYRNQAKLAIKDHYTFDFLELADAHAEHELENALIENMRKFLSEMGSHYTFMGSQFKLQIEGQNYYIDLLLFHRHLKSFIAIELKVGDFKPEYKGKMEFYLNILNDTMKLPHENDAIGIIICKNKKRTIVEYALKNSTHPIGVSTYSLSESLPDSYKNLLPDGEAIAKRLMEWGEMELGDNNLE